MHHEPHIQGADDQADEKMREDFRLTRERYMDAYGHDMFMTEEYKTEASCKNKPKPKPKCASPGPGPTCGSSCSSCSSCGAGCGCVEPEPGMILEDFMCKDALKKKSK